MVTSQWEPLSALCFWFGVSAPTNTFTGQHCLFRTDEALDRTRQHYPPPRANSASHSLRTRLSPAAPRVQHGRIGLASHDASISSHLRCTLHACFTRPFCTFWISRLLPRTPHTTYMELFLLWEGVVTSSVYSTLCRLCSCHIDINSRVTHIPLRAYSAHALQRHPLSVATLFLAVSLFIIATHHTWHRAHSLSWGGDVRFVDRVIQ